MMQGSGVAAEGEVEEAELKAGIKELQKNIAKLEKERDVLKDECRFISQLTAKESQIAAKEFQLAVKENKLAAKKIERAELRKQETLQLESAQLAADGEGKKRKIFEDTGGDGGSTVAAGFETKSVWLKHGEIRAKFDFSRCRDIFELILALRKETALRIDPFGTIEIYEPQGTAPLSIDAELDQLFTADIVKNSNRKPFIVKSISVDWIPETAAPYYLEEDRMYFVNRHDAVTQLQRVHENNMIRAKGGEGRTWKIPLVDNLPGMGKSALANHYVRQCRIHSTYESHNWTPDFKNKILDCHTIVISFASYHGALVGADQDAVIRGMIENKIRGLIRNAPLFLEKQRSGTVHLLTDLTASGAVFLAMDEIGRAFDKATLSDLEKRNLFCEFCESLVCSLLAVPDLFILLSGRASFLSLVGREGASRNKISPCPFVRICLQNLGPVYIEEIIRQTQFSQMNPVNLKTHFRIDEGRIKDVSEHLFHVTNGHPRSLIEALKTCSTEEDLLDYDEPLEGPLDWPRVKQELVKHKAIFTSIFADIDKGRSVNLTRFIEDTGQSQVTLDRIVSRVYLSWQGTMEVAMLCGRPALLNFLRGCYLSLHEYLEGISRIEAASLKCSISIEWMYIMRMQEFFAAKASPSEVSPFFQNTSFGQCHDVVLSADVLPIPRITANGSSAGSLSSSTATCSAWPQLLTSMEQLDCGCFKPLMQSDSADAIFIVKSVRFGRRVLPLYVGSGAKCLYVAEFTADNFRDECDKFNAMFLQQKDRNRLNILIICATKYARTFSDQFGKRKSMSIKKPEGFEHIDEVILLNLQSKINRALFYGFNPGSQLAEAVECMIERKEKERRRH